MVYCALSDRICGLKYLYGLVNQQGIPCKTLRLQGILQPFQICIFPMKHFDRLKPHQHQLIRFTGMTLARHI